MVELLGGIEMVNSRDKITPEIIIRFSIPVKV
jgi:hypothetical protein